MTLTLKWTGEEVVNAVRGHSLHEQTWSASGVAIDSRSVKKGDLFVALKGPHHDAHEFVANAVAAGCSAAIVSHQSSQVPSGSPLVFVDDTFKALELLGQAGRQRAQSRIIAVTGSVGKTSSKEMLRLMLGAVGTCYANEGSLNNQWGVPLSLARLPADADYGVFEIGMNHAGELTVLSQQVKPHIALITTIEAVHLEFFDSLEGIADAKAEIFQGLPPEGIAILNQDNPYYARLATAAKNQGIKKILGFGQNGKRDARMLSFVPTPEGATIKADIQGKMIDYHLSAFGVHNALNSLGTLLTAVVAGGDAQACAAALAHYHLPSGRGGIQIIHLAQGSFTLIDESYNASPASMRAAINVLAHTEPSHTGGRRIMVLGDMKELGPTSPSLHAGLAKDLVDGKIDRVYCCGEMMAHLFEALPPSLRGGHVLESKALIQSVVDNINCGDVITIKGSHSMNMNVIVNSLKELNCFSNPSHKCAS